ncbi:VWA domain-containing protein [Xanthobacter sp. KR7-225]|uniref:VWA domain-containing protein n=1 Tax=Xanthobacter sp. KR7-225 TaxID=3156613 RepID=UPI0032B5E56D
MPRVSIRAGAVAFLLLALTAPAVAQAPPPPLISLGDAVVTGFSGTIEPDPAQPRPPGKSRADLIFIDPEGAAARILDVGRPGAPWNAAVMDAPSRLDLPAKTIGQVFGVALDDAPAPNAYLAATSAFGLAIVGRGPDGMPERRRQGGPGTSWMAGQFGLDLSGGPGSIYRVDGTSGEVTLFAEVMLNGAANPAPALGNLAYDGAHRQLLVSDLHTGMVHRFSVDDGTERGPPFDHGVQGRTAARLPPVAFAPANRPNIASARFKADDPGTWGFAPPARRVFALAVQDGRLFYSVNNGAPAEPPQVWSVGFTPDGGFAGDARFELAVPAAPGPYPVTDMVFSHTGVMILAQRAPQAASWDFAAFTRPGEPRVLRYRLETPDDPRTAGRWIPQPEEYAVGFAGAYRNANGGVDLGYGYGPDNLLVTGAGCESTLWATGQKLRDAPALRTRLEAGGPLLVDGLQASPSGPARSFNAPPETSYFVDYDGQPADPRAAGHMGGVRIRKAPCVPPVAWYGGPGYPSAPPYVVVVSDPPGGCPWGAGFGGGCGEVTGGCLWGLGPNGICGPVVIDCILNPDPRLCPLPPVDLTLEKTVSGEPKYDPKTGLWTLTFTLTVTNAGIPFPPGASIAISDPVPPGMTFISAAGTGWLCLPAPPLSSGNLNCRHNFGPGILGTGASANPLTVTATVKEPGKYKNCGTVGLWPGAPFYETDLANNTACAEVEVKKLPVDIAIKKTGKTTAGGGGPVGEGAGGLSYTLAVTNVGPGFAGAGAITVTDVVPAGVTFTTITAPSDWTCTPAPIAAGGTLTCTYNGTGPAAPGDALGAIGITATATGNGPWENCTNAAIAPAAGTDANLDDNKSCVTLEKEDEFDDPDDPPPVPKMCGVNVIFVVDESGSVGSSAGQVTSALSSAAAILNTNGAQAAVIHFSDAAQLVQPMSTSTWGSIASGYAPVGGTNWEAGLAAAAALLPGPPPGTIVVFITDGVPNAALDGSGSTFYTDSVTATNEAIPVVNQIYAAGVPVIGIGIGSVSTHLNALLGGNVQMTNFGGLSGALTGLAKQLCPSLYLSKAISPSFINFHDTPNVTEVTVTLNLTNTAGNLTNVVVEDNLPAQLTGATIVSTSASPPSSAVAGDPVVWTIPAMAQGDTATLTFKVTLAPSAPIPTDGSWLCYNNFAQVTAVGSGTVGSVPNNMANAETGPVHEPDEARARVCLRNYDPPDPVPCTTPYLWVKKTPLNEVCRPPVQGVESALPCKFTVTVTAQCTDFNGPVLFGDGLFSGSSPNPLPIASITSNPPVACTWSSGSPSTCPASNLSLPLGQTITFTVTLGAPIPAGTYTNCFLADGKTPVPTDYPTAYADVTPSTGGSGDQWGHCANFVVAEPAPAIAGCPQGQILADGKCVRRPPPPPPPVLCPAGTRLRFGACVKEDVCPPPKVPTPRGTCECPPGTMERGRECVKAPACAPPKVLTPKGTCECPPGTMERGRACVKVPACAPPKVLGPRGTCECPPGLVERGRACVKVPACAPPKVLGPRGSCDCPPGLVERGRSCVKPPPKPAPLSCIPPAFPDRAGTHCLCPQGMRVSGRTCVPAQRRPDADPRKPSTSAPPFPRQDQRGRTGAPGG